LINRPPVFTKRCCKLVSDQLSIPAGRSGLGDALPTAALGFQPSVIFSALNGFDKRHQPSSFDRCPAGQVCATRVLLNGLCSWTLTANPP